MVLHHNPSMACGPDQCNHCRYCHIENEDKRSSKWSNFKISGSAAKYNLVRGKSQHLGNNPQMSPLPIPPPRRSVALIDSSTSSCVECLCRNFPPNAIRFAEKCHIHMQANGIFTNCWVFPLNIIWFAKKPDIL